MILNLGLGSDLDSGTQADPCTSLGAVGTLSKLTFGVNNVSSSLGIIDAWLHFIQPWCLHDAQGCGRGCCLHWAFGVSDALSYGCWLDDCHRYPAVAAAGWCPHTQTDTIEATSSTTLLVTRHLGTLEQSPHKLCIINCLSGGKHMIGQTTPFSIDAREA